MASTASISALPTELVVFVTDNLDRLKDLSALALVDRKLYNTVNSILYKRAASRGDAWPLAWAAHCGVAGTLKKALAAGTDPNYEFIDGVPADKWKKNSAAARLAVHENVDIEVWDTDNECDSNPDADWSPETEDSDHAATITTNQLSSNPNSDPWGNLAFNDSDRDISDVSMDDPYILHGRDDDSSILDDVDLVNESVLDHYRLAIKRRFKPIHLAARAGNNDIIKILLDHGANVNVSSESLCDCARLCGLLNAAECPERDTTPPTWSPLHIAICHSHPETAKLLLSRAASYMMELDVSPRHDYSSTALHHAAAEGLVDVVKYLLDEGIQSVVDVRDDKTLTPFYYAYAFRRWDSTVPLLLERGADINVDTKMFLPYTTITPFGEACRLGTFDEADRLLDLGADPDRGFIATSTGGGLSPLHMCCMPSAKPVGVIRTARLFEEEERGIRRMRTMEKLVARGAVLEAKDCSGDTPLMLAAQNHNIPALRAVIKAGANVHQRNGVGRNAVMQAIIGSSHPPLNTSLLSDMGPLTLTLRELFNNGARLDERDSEGNTVLHAVFRKRPRDHPRQTATLRILLNRPGGCSLVQVKNRVNITPLKMALMDGNLEACEILARKGGLHGETVDLEEMNNWLQHTTTFEYEDREKAIEFILDLDTTGEIVSDPALLSGLLTGPCSYSAAARIVWRRGVSAIPATELSRLLSLALRAEDFDLAYSLLEAGADVDGEPGDGKSPLAAYIGSIVNIDSSVSQQFLEALLDRGANIHVPYSSGSCQRILNRIIKMGREECLAIMLNKQPLANDARAVGGCYLHDAVIIQSDQQPPNERIIDMLLASGANVSEVNQDGDTPLSALLKSLCKHRLFTWRYHRYIKRLFGSEVDINRRNTEGRSIADYLETLMQKNSRPDQTTFLTRRVQLIDPGDGTKVLKFLPRPHKRVKPRNVIGS